MPGLPRLATIAIPCGARVLGAFAVAAVTVGSFAAPHLESQAPATLRGVAFDSVAMRPLAAAFVSLGGTQSTFSDSLGRFEFANTAAGTHLLEMTHARLDSMGLPGVSLRVRIDADVAPITIAVPSFATLWRAACGERMAPDDSGFVYGTIRRAGDG